MPSLSRGVRTPLTEGIVRFSGVVAASLTAFSGQGTVPLQQHVLII
jgi:hypothetical protein